MGSTQWAPGCRPFQLKSARVAERPPMHAQMSALRKALGEDRDLIRTERGRGYRLTALVSAIAAPSACRVRRGNATAQIDGRFADRPVG